jgi:DNA repair exonuclease SbcCD ATPase subunit
LGTILNLEDRVETLVAENRQLQEAKERAEESLQNAVYQSDIYQKQIDTQRTQEAAEEHNLKNSQKKAEFSQLQQKIDAILTITDRDVEIEGLRSELHAATEQIKTLQGQILTVKQTDSSLTVRDEDYFDNVCQELYRHVNQWVQRFSEVSRTRACTLSSDIRDQELKVILKNTTLDGSDVDTYLADRVKRRDVLMSVVMNMIGERVFASYLFGMGRMQREVLQALERNFYQVGK